MDKLKKIGGVIAGIALGTSVLFSGCVTVGQANEYGVARSNGYTGTIQEWTKEQQYQSWLSAGNEGKSMEDFEMARAEEFYQQSRDPEGTRHSHDTSHSRDASR
jgi:hypothetical protein